MLPKDTQIGQDLFGSPRNLPRLHTGESLYSWCARSHLLNGMPDPRRLSASLFGDTQAALIHDIPKKISELSRTAPLKKEEIEAIARQNTLLSFYLPWLQPDLARNCVQHVMYGGIPGLKMHLGLPASLRTRIHPLKGCMSCFEEQSSEHGYAYWDIRQQSPSSWFCEKHDSVLSARRTNGAPSRKRRWHMPLDEEGEWETPDVRDLNARGALRDLAGLTSELDGLPPSHLCRQKLSAIYRQALRRKGLATRKGQVRITRLIAKTQIAYSGLDSIPGLRAVGALSDVWAGFVGGATRRATRPVHPIYHLLLINLLFDGGVDFVRQYDAFNEQSEGEPNPGSPKKDNLDDRRQIFRTLVVDLRLSLTAAGNKVGVSPTTAVQWAKQLGIPYTHRTKYVTDGKRRIVRRMLRKGLPKKVAANAIGCSMTTITRILSANPRLRDLRSRSIRKALRQVKRKQFLQRISENPGVPVNVLRKTPGSGYAWLYRNDRSWLRENLPMLPHAD